MNNTAQVHRFRKAARESGADMSKEEFARVIGKITKPTPPGAKDDPVPGARIEEDRE